MNLCFPQLDNPTAPLQSRRFRVLLLVALLTLGMSGSALAKENGEYAVPSLKGFALVRTFTADTDETQDGTEESVVSVYRNDFGDQIGSISTNGYIWLWSRRDRNYEQNRQDTNLNFSIRDTDCSGVFRERYASGEHFFLPQCLRE